MAAYFSANISGHRQFQHRFGRSYPQAAQLYKTKLRKVVEQVLERSQELVPVEFGDLKESGKLVTHKENNQVVSYAITYGDQGRSREYAFWVEVREYAASGKKVFHEPPTQAWYVKTAHDENIQHMRDSMAEVLQELRKKYANG